MLEIVELHRKALHHSIGGASEILSIYIVWEELERERGREREWERERERVRERACPCYKPLLTSTFFVWKVWHENC